MVGQLSKNIRLNTSDKEIDSNLKYKTLVANIYKNLTIHEQVHVM